MIPSQQGSFRIYVLTYCLAGIIATVIVALILVQGDDSLEPADPMVEVRNQFVSGTRICAIEDVVTTLQNCASC